MIYSDIPRLFRFSNGIWIRRKNKVQDIKKYPPSIGRMYSAAPNNPERFFLRLLLTHVKGATSYEHLRTGNFIMRQ